MKTLLILAMLAATPALAQSDTVYVRMENPARLRDTINMERILHTRLAMENYLLVQQNDSLNSKEARWWFVALLITVVGIGSTIR